MLRLLCILLLVPVFATAFPDHLQGPGGCATELATDEVIMNQFVTAYEDSRDQEVQIVVQAEDGTLLESPIFITEVPMTFVMVVVNPNRLENVQYVMDTTAGKFERGQCEGEKRVTGTRVGREHKLTIYTIPDAPVQVWAGWSCGRETVTLTNYFFFQKEEPEFVNEVNDL